jgi:hypothetical protein
MWFVPMHCPADNMCNSSSEQETYIMFGHRYRECSQLTDHKDRHTVIHGNELHTSYCRSSLVEESVNTLGEGVVPRVSFWLLFFCVHKSTCTKISNATHYYTCIWQLKYIFYFDISLLISLPVPFKRQKVK